MLPEWGNWYDWSQGAEDHSDEALRLARELLPTMYDLPSETVGEPGLPDSFHPVQARLLSETCLPPRYPEGNVFMATDLYLYYDLGRPFSYKRPDWFLAVGVPRATQQRDLRLSYVMWQERVKPLVMVELLSPGTVAEDLGRRVRAEAVEEMPTKWEVYGQILQVPYYVVYDRYERDLRVFCWWRGGYELAVLSEDGRFGIEELGLGLGLWDGCYDGVNGTWLRWYRTGDCVPTPQEAYLLARAERSRAEAAELRAERLAQLLREQGVDPEALG